MVLAAGLGTRLRPLTDVRAKPAVPFLGVPVVRRIVARLAERGFDRIVVNLHHRPDSIREALDGCPVHWSPEDPIRGTAGGPGLALARGLLRADEPLLVVNGKIDCEMKFDALVEEHVTKATAHVTMALVLNHEREAFREVEVRDGRITGFGPGREPVGPNPLAFTGVHVLGPEVLGRLSSEPADTIRDVYPPLIAAGLVAAAIHDGRWWEFSTPERYLGLHLRARALGLAERAPRAAVAPGAQLDASVLWDDARVGDDVHLDRCIVISGADVPPGTEARLTVFSADERRALDPDAVRRAAGPGLGR
jgi:mannose-1-phosphate guanylyltransferase